MTTAVATRFDLMGLAPLNFGIEVVATLPSTGLFSGRMVWNTAGGAAYIYNGTAWVAFGISGAVGAHTHPISDITDLQSTLDAKATKAVATGSVDGLLSAANFTKLAGIATGAQVNAVTTVNGRTGAVIAASGDYGAAMISYTASGTTLSATTVQAAINEMDAKFVGKANATHTHTSSAITDFQTAVRNEIVAWDASIAGSDVDFDTLRERIDRLKQLTSDVASFGTKRFGQDVGNAAALTFAVTHNFATLDVQVAIFRKSDGAEVIADVTRTSTNVVTVGFAVAPTASQYRVVITA